MENGLDGWTQRMVFSGVMSIRLASRGVPQAAVVGPTLHSAFINDLDYEMECTQPICG